MTTQPNGDDPEAAARREQRSKEARVKALLLIEETAELLRASLNTTRFIPASSPFLQRISEDTFPHLGIRLSRSALPSLLTY